MNMGGQEKGSHRCGEWIVSSKKRSVSTAPQLVCIVYTLFIYLTSFLAGVQRKTTKDVTLSDGTFLPQGTLVAVAAYAIEHDHHNYENPFSSEPFRFVDLQDKCDDPSKYQLTFVSHDFLVFGLGKSAW